MSKDLDYIARLEKAISRKYGDKAVLNPMSNWSEEREKEYLEQLKALDKKRLEKEGSSHIEANNEASNNVLAKQQLFTSIPRRFSVPMRDIWYLQFRLSNRFGKKAEAILKHKRFRAAYDFLLLREQAGEKLNNLGEWWTLYQNKDKAERLAMGKKGKRRKHRSKP